MTRVSKDEVGYFWVPTRTLDKIVGIAKKVEHVGSKIQNKHYPGTDWSDGKPVRVLNPTRQQLPFARRRSSMEVAFPGRRVSKAFETHPYDAEKMANDIANSMTYAK
jgi:hypothetical protein